MMRINNFKYNVCLVESILKRASSQNKYILLIAWSKRCTCGRKQAAQISHDNGGQLLEACSCGIMGHLVPTETMLRQP